MKTILMRILVMACLFFMTNSLFSQGITVTGTVEATTLSGTLSTSAMNSITTTGQLTNLSVAGTIQGGALSGTITTAAQPNITSLGTLSSLAVTGLIDAGTLSGTITTAAQPNITSLGTLSSLAVTGLVDAGTLSGTITTAAQPNITSVGTLSNLTVTGSITANNFLSGFTTIATAAGTTVLTTNSTYIQEFTGTTTQIVTLPVTTTMTAGESFFILNNSTGTVTVNSSGGNLVKVMPANSQVLLTCVLASGTTAASWSQSNTYSYVTGGGVGSIITNSAGIVATETAIVSSIPLVADRLLVGTVVRITIEGTHTATVARVPTFRVRLGTAGTTADGVIATTAFAASAAAGTAIPFRVVIELTVRTVGAAATISGLSHLINQGTTGISTTATQVVVPTFAAFNTQTNGNIITATLQMAGASSTATITNAFIEFVYK